MSVPAKFDRDTFVSGLVVSAPAEPEISSVARTSPNELSLTEISDEVPFTEPTIEQLLEEETLPGITRAELEHLRRQLQVFQKLSSVIAAPSGPQQSLLQVLQSLCEAFSVETAVLLRYNPADRSLTTLRPAFHSAGLDIGEWSFRLEPDTPGLFGRAYSAAEPVYINRTELEPLVNLAFLNALNCKNALALPLIVAGELRGMCCLINNSSGGFDSQDTGLLAGLSGLLLAVLKNVEQALELEHQRRRHLAVLDAAVDGFIEVAPDLKITHFSQGAESLTGWKTEAALDRYCYEVLNPHTETGADGCEDCPMQRAFQTGAPVSNVEMLVGNRESEDNWVSCTYNPVVDGRGQPLAGLITLKDIYRLKALSEELRVQARQQESLLGVNNAINGLSNIEEIYRESLKEVAKAIRFDLATIHFINPADNELVLKSVLEAPLSSGNTARPAETTRPTTGQLADNPELTRRGQRRNLRPNPLSSYISRDLRVFTNSHMAHECQALLRNEPYLAVNLPHQSTCPVLSDFDGIQSHVCVPINTQKAVYGVLHLASRDAHAFWGSDYVLALNICKQIAVAAERASLFEQVDRLARTDALTGLYNKREFWERFEHEIRRAELHQASLSLLLIDLDRLKWINDNFGHSQGDLLLTRLGDLLRDECRATDIAFRYGGDELCIILPDTAHAEARQVADRLRAAARQLKFTASDDQIIIGSNFQVTMSIGIASYPADATTPTQLFEYADAAMYRAKETGKDRSVIFDPQIDLSRLNYRRRVTDPEAKDDRLRPPRSRTTTVLPQPE